MLNKSKLFLNLLCDELTNEYEISKESFDYNKFNNGLRDVLSARGNLDKFGLTPDEVIAHLSENLGITYEDVSTVTNFMINEIIDKGSKEEQQLVYKYIQAKENLAQIEDVLNSRINNYRSDAKEFYTGINNVSNLINKFINTTVEK